MSESRLAVTTRYFLADSAEIHTELFEHLPRQSTSLAQQAKKDVLGAEAAMV